MKYDILIVGAGPAGLAFAAMMGRNAHLRIGVIEKQDAKILAAPAYDGREIALTHGSKTTMEEAGLWEHIPANEIARIRDAKVTSGASSYALHFDHREAGQDNLGFAASNHLIRRAAWLAANSYKNVHFITGVEAVAAGTDEHEAWIALSDGRRLTAPLLIAADSRFSPLRDMMGIPAAKLDFKRLCIVCRMSHTRPHDDTAWECFFDDMTLATIPLPGKMSSIVMTLPAQTGEELVRGGGEGVVARVERYAGKRLGRMKLESALFPYPLVAVYAQKFCGRRFALLGDAAVGMHPVTAHGFNFGLRGARTLTDELEAGLLLGLDLGNSQALENYHSAHLRATQPIYHGTNTLVGLYTSTKPPARLARRALLILGNNLGPARRGIMKMLTEAGKAG